MWSLLKTELLQRERFEIACLILLSWTANLRPLEALRLRRCDLQRHPVGTRGHAARHEDREKDTGLFVTALAWAPPVWAALRRDGSKAKLFEVSYHDYQKTVSSLAKRLGFAAVPYQLRHSGPSYNILNKCRSTLEVLRRGRWVSRKSLDRCAKATRLAAEWGKLDEAPQQRAIASEVRLVEEFLARRPGPALTGDERSPSRGLSGGVFWRAR